MPYLISKIGTLIEMTSNMRHLSTIIVLVFAFFLTACGQQQAPQSELLTDSQSFSLKYRFNKNINYTLEPLYFPLYHPDSLVKLSNNYIGTRYQDGGKTPNGFDCSGFTFFIHKQFGIYLPNSSALMAQIGVEIDLDNALPGDLIFFKGENKRDKYAGHVGIVVSKPGEPMRFIHASTSRGIRYDLLENNVYFLPRFMFVKRIVE